MEIPLERPEWAGLFDRIENTEDLQQCIVDISKSLQIEYVAFHIDHSSVKMTGIPYIKTNFPAEWVRRYLVMDYARIDPILAHFYDSAAPSFWHNLALDGPDLEPFFKDAVRYGVPEDGYIVPVHGQSGSRAMINCASHRSADEWLEKIKEFAPALKRCAQLMYEKAIAEISGQEPDCPSLTQREIECLFWVAQGKDAGSIAIILGLSEHTVRDYCKSARHKMGCSTLYQAIHRATLLGILKNKVPS